MLGTMTIRYLVVINRSMVHRAIDFLSLKVHKNPSPAVSCGQNLPFSRAVRSLLVRFMISRLESLFLHHSLYYATKVATVECIYCVSGTLHHFFESRI